MKVDFEKLKEPGLYEEPQGSGKKTRAAPDRVPGIQIKSREERVPGVRLKSQRHARDPKPDFWSYPSWMRQGAAAMAMMFALCLTVTAVWEHLGPPGNAAADERGAVTASMDEAADMTEKQVRVTEMDMAGSGNTIEVMQMAMTNTPEATDETAKNTVAQVIVRDITEGVIPADGETDSEKPYSETVSELEATQDEEPSHANTDELPDGPAGANINELPDEPAGEPLAEQSSGLFYEDNGESQDKQNSELFTDSNGLFAGYGGEDLFQKDTDGEVTEGGTGPEDQTLFAVAKVDGMLNVRAEASEDAEVTGMLYKDAGGKILEQTDGWTQIESGDLTGWVQDELLEMTTEEELLSSEKAVMEAEVIVSSLNVRTDSNTDAQIIGSVRNGDRVEIINVQEDGWAEVAYNDGTAYINTNYADVGLSLQTGDTIEAYIEKVAEQRKAKVAQAEENAAEAGLEMTVTEEYVPQDASDLEMLATIIYCEAGNQSHEGKVAVGNVVLNRVGSAKFPNDINSVLRADRQFSPVGSGKYDRMLGSGRIPQSCYDAAQEAMDGISYVGGCLYFKNPDIAGAHSGITIGDHVFW